MTCAREWGSVTLLHRMAFRPSFVELTAGAFAFAVAFVVALSTMNNSGNELVANLPGGGGSSSSSSAVCGNSIVESGEYCDEGTGVNGMPGSCCSASCTYEVEGYTCRVSNGVCDVAEVCSGESEECPADSKQASSTVCNPSNGVCDVVEYCDGVSVTCPTDGFASSATSCRGSAGVCDVVEYCTGNSAACPSDGFASSATVCNPSAGDCDVAEYCPGNSASCPSNGYQSSGTSCNADSNGCTVGDACNGAGSCVAGSAPDCDDLYECTTDVCQSASNSSYYCQSTIDSDSCIIEGVCYGNGEQNIATPCLYCNSGSSQSAWTNATSSVSCNDNQSCTTPDRCNGAGSCTGTVSCTPNECQIGGACDVNGNCSFTNKDNGTTCGSGSSAGYCVSGSCMPGQCYTNADCGTSNTCVTYTCNTQTLTCNAPSYASAETDCNADSNGCTYSDKCNGNGLCVAGSNPPPDCNDAYACTTDTCNSTGNTTYTCSNTINEGSCLIDGACHSNTSSNPSNDCQYCSASFNNSSWTNRTAGFACGDQTSDLCDAANTCNDSGVCQANYSSAGTVCRASAGVCDVAESCSGSSAACPAEGYQSSGTQCRASAGVCDVAEACTGNSASCPSDGYQSSGTVCRSSAGICDVAEACTGSSTACPSDGFQSSGTQCRAADGLCDVAEACAGNSASCPTDTFMASGTVCRSSASGGCDIAETCTGSAGACPDDSFQTSSTICRPAADAECDIAEACTGGSASCPTDAYQPAATICGDQSINNTCNGSDSCNGSGVCNTNTAVEGTSCSEAGSVQCKAGQCNVSNVCTLVNVPDCSNCCNDGNASTENDSCTSGTCSGTPICGNGIIDEGEDCDPNTNNPVSCPCSDPLTCNVNAEPTSCMNFAGFICADFGFAGGTLTCDDECSLDTAYCEAGSSSGGSSSGGVDLCAGVTCTAPGQCYVAGTCNSGTGQCTSPTFKADNTPCNDNDANTSFDKCLSGVCRGNYGDGSGGSGGGSSNSGGSSSGGSSSGGNNSGGSSSTGTSSSGGSSSTVVAGGCFCSNGRDGAPVKQPAGTGRVSYDECKTKVLASDTHPKRKIVWDCSADTISSSSTGRTPGTVYNVVDLCFVGWGELTVDRSKADESSEIYSYCLFMGESPSKCASYVVTPQTSATNPLCPEPLGDVNITSNNP